MTHPLHHLQTSWDDEAAHLRVTRYRVRPAIADLSGQHPGGGMTTKWALVRPAPTPPQADGIEAQVRADIRWLPVLLPLLAITVTLIAAVLP